MEKTSSKDLCLTDLKWIDKVLYLSNNKADTHIIKALIRTKPESEWSLLYELYDSVIYNAIYELKWEEENISFPHKIKNQPKYRAINTVLKDFNSKGKRQAARKELQIRLPYLTANEQKKTLIAFLNSEAKVDYTFASKYLYNHYEPKYLEALVNTWKSRHFYDVAKVLTHYAPDMFIAENFEQLAKDYRYLFVRMRMPVDYPIDRTRLEDNEFLHLCAHLHLQITEEEAFSILSNTLHKQLSTQPYFSGKSSLYDIKYVGGIIKDLGRLGFNDLIMRFYIENERTKQLLSTGGGRKIALSVKEQIYQDGFQYLNDDAKTKNVIEDLKSKIALVNDYEISEIRSEESLNRLKDNLEVFKDIGFETVDS